ncbi:LbtU family siderophore porin [Legionella spiritensis]|uniref:LbtU family siderophore porin n=1 Tax=Legionella spiritensis TaxID=452 RepID=UPI000F70DA4B|nr:LbtU family siderophore porin [Legionella spiritensis]VEG90855.1 coiled-coil protein [Legionella spiritensis]
MIYIRVIIVILLHMIVLNGRTYALPRISDKLSYQGHVFFNVTDSAPVGESYLLNQQLSSVKLESEYQPGKWSRLKGLLIYNTTPTPITPTFFLEQLYAGVKRPELPKWYLEVGRKWLAFGSYRNDLIYKPLTKALGQTNEQIIVIGYDSLVYANAGIFYPHSRIQSSSLPVYYNLNGGFHKKHYDVGISYIYSLADSQLFQYNKGFGGFLSGSVTSHVPGMAAYANLKYRRFNTYITYVSAIKRFKVSEVSYQNAGALPHVFSVQTGYEIPLKNTLVKVIGFYDQSFQALALQLPQKRAGLGLSWYPSSRVTLQFQYFKDYNYSQFVQAGGLNRTITGNATPRNTFALQAIVNF